MKTNSHRFLKMSSMAWGDFRAQFLRCYESFWGCQVVSNFFHIPLTLLKVSKYSEMVMHFLPLKVAETVWNDPIVTFAYRIFRVARSLGHYWSWTDWEITLEQHYKKKGHRDNSFCSNLHITNLYFINTCL